MFSDNISVFHGTYMQETELQKLTAVVTFEANFRPGNSPAYTVLSRRAPPTMSECCLPPHTQAMINHVTISPSPSHTELSSFYITRGALHNCFSSYSEEPV